MKHLVALCTFMATSLSLHSMANCVTNKMGNMSLTTCNDGSSHLQNNMGNVGISSGYNNSGSSWTGVTTRSGNVSNISITESDGRQQGYSVYRTGTGRGKVHNRNTNSWSTYEVNQAGVEISDDDWSED